MKTYRQSVFRSLDFWFYIAGIYACLLLRSTLGSTGFFLIAGLCTGLYLLHFVLRNQIVLDDRKITIVNPFTRRTYGYRFDELERVEFINDLRINPRIRLTTRDGKIRWHYLEGICSHDYRSIAAHLEDAGICVEMKKMKAYLKQE